MTKKKLPRANTIPPEVLEILGPPPILSSEDEKVYYATLVSFSKHIIAESSLLLVRVRVIRARILDNGSTQGAFPQLLALERYESRATSRRRRAIRTLGAFQQCKIGRYLTGPNPA